MSSGQWDLQALEAIEREASEIFDVLDVPERLRSPASKPKQPPVSSTGTGSKKMSSSSSSAQSLSSCRPFCGDNNRSSTSSPVSDENVDLELQDHIKHCSCSCNHMGYGNYMDYQVRVVNERRRWSGRKRSSFKANWSENKVTGRILVLRAAEG